MKRLTTKGFNFTSNFVASNLQSYPIAEALKKLQEYEDAEEQEFINMDNNKPKCPACGSDLELGVGYTGCDWNCEAGENSGYEYEVSLCCPKEGCGRVFTLGMIKKISDFSLIKK